MLDCVRCSEPLLPVKAVRRTDGGTDIWLRKNMKGPLTEQSEEGLSNAFYEADEAFLRVATEVTEQDVSKEFDRYWELAMMYTPQSPGEEAVSQADMLEMMTDLDCRLIMVELGV